MATLQEIHNEELKIMSFFDSVCRREKVHYSMIGGTMLGAIRHQGFIPWDDDIDVFMKMEDFERVKKSLTNETYFLQTPESDIEMPFAMYKIRRNNSKMLEPDMESLSMHQGIWIDIFVYTHAGKTELQKRLQKMVFLFLKTYRCRHLNRNLYKKKLTHKCLTLLPKCMQLLIDKALMKLIQLLGSKKSEEYFALDVGKYTIYPKTFFDNVNDYLFEDKYFMGPSDSDGFLTMVFGKDYMVPRKWGHLPDHSNVIIE